MNNIFRIYVFGSNRHYQNFKNSIDNSCCEVVHIGEESEDHGKSKSEIEIFDEFKNVYQRNIETKGFVIFGRATVQGGIENIAKAVEIIKKEYIELQCVPVIGPSVEAAKIFNDKSLTQKVLSDYNIPTPKTALLDFGSENLMEIVNSFNFPVVLKALGLSGGCGMKFVKDESVLQVNIADLRTEGIKDLIITEFIKGVEVTYTVLRLGDTFLRLPVSYKKETDELLTHPDAKVKLAGFYEGYDQHYHYVEEIMRKYSIFGLFTLQGVLVEDNMSDKYDMYFLEAATRMTGSTPIMSAALEGFDLYKTIANWIISRKIRFGYKKSHAIQYSSYQHKGMSSVDDLIKLDWVIEAKYESLSKMLCTNDRRDRIRISFNVNPQENLIERLRAISDILKNPSYAEEVIDVINYFREKRMKENDLKCLEGVWNENTSWEFYLSDYLPEPNLCTAVFALLKHKGKIVLTKTRRGWEMPGGHIEEGETIEEALQREVLEEAGAHIVKFKLIGYRKIITKKQDLNGRNANYPFPFSYIPHYIAVAEADLVKPTGDEDEILESGEFLPDELHDLNSEVMPIIDVCLKRFNEID